MIKAIFFDYHGVLDKRTFKNLINLIAKLSFNHEDEISEKDHIDRIFEKYEKLGSSYASGKIAPKTFWTMLEKDPSTKHIVNKAREYIFTIEPNKELWDLLPVLRKKYILGILSNCPEEKASLIMKTLNINNNFDACYFSCDYGLSKTNAEFFDLMLMGFNFSKEECLFIDDSEDNIEFAKNLGFQTQLYTGIDSIKKFL